MSWCGAEIKGNYDDNNNNSNENDEGDGLTSISVMLLHISSIHIHISFTTTHSTTHPNMLKVIAHWSASAERLCEHFNTICTPPHCELSQSPNLFNFVCCSEQYLGLIWNASLIMIIIIFPCQFTFRTYFWSGGDLFLVYLYTVNVNWMAMVWGMASFDRADHASNVIWEYPHTSNEGIRRIKWNGRMLKYK